MESIDNKIRVKVKIAAGGSAFFSSDFAAFRNQKLEQIYAIFVPTDGNAFASCARNKNIFVLLRKIAYFCGSKMSRKNIIFATKNGIKYHGKH
jgi:hypothetical protein